MADVELRSITSSDGRRAPRVSFNAQVELLARDDGNDQQRVLIARALDLGTGGMGLSMRERLPVGTKVTCRLELDGRDAALDGRVAWSRSNTSPRPHGLGIHFDDLAEHERELLAHVVDRTQAGYRPVELRFEGAQTPLIARARPTHEGLRVSTPLPMLNQGAELSVRFEGEGQAFAGRIVSVVVREEDGTRRLEVDLALSDAASVRFRRQARYGYADELSSADGGAERAHAEHDHAEHDHAEHDHAERDRAERVAPEANTTTGRHPARPRRLAASAYASASTSTSTGASSSASPVEESMRAPRWRFAPVVAVLRIAGSLLLAASCGALLSAWLERSWYAFDARPGSPPIVVERAVDPSAASLQSASSPTGEPNAANPISPVGEHEAGVARHELIDRMELRAQTSDASDAAALPSAGQSAAHLQAIAAPSTVPAVAPVLNSSQPTEIATQAATPSQPTGTGASATSTSSAARRAKPSLNVESGVTVVAVPFTGSLDGMQTRTWASPPAIAIDLPQGSARIDHGYYPLSGGIAAGLRVRERNKQLLVRVLLAQPAGRIAVTAQRESLEIRLTPAP